MFPTSFVRKKHSKFNIPLIVFFSVLEPYENFVLKVLSILLTDGPMSPFYKSLINSDLGLQYSPGTGYNLLVKVQILLINSF